MATNQPKPIPQLTDAEIQRFWSKVDKGAPTACWPWTGHHTHTDGYGLLKVQRKTYGGHRLSYAIHKGPIPSGLIVRHTCDNPKCVNPLHLELGTVLDNIRDRDKRGRACSGDRHFMRRDPIKAARHIAHLVAAQRTNPPKGEKNARAKLTASQVREIRTRHAVEGITGAALGREYGVSKEMIYYILRGLNWTHVD